MASIIIKWSRKYNEDLGTLDRDGFYDYAYRYFVYSFYLPGKDRIVIRSYIENSLEGNVFIFRGDILDRKDEVNSELVSAVLSFMYAKQNIIHFKRFDGDYKPIDLSEIKDNYNCFSFVEIEPIE